MPIGRFELVCCAVLSALLCGCGVSVRSFVDPALPAASRESVFVIPDPRPVQVVYDFRSNGSANPGAAEGTLERVLAAARKSALFTDVATTAVSNGHRLVITVNSFAISDTGEARSKGFGSGLTFGPAGTMVTEGFEMEAQFINPGSAPLAFRYRHALHSTIGSDAGPAGLQAYSVADAIGNIVEQMTWSVLRDLSKSGRI